MPPLTPRPDYEIKKPRLVAPKQYPSSTIPFGKPSLPDLGGPSKIPNFGNLATLAEMRLFGSIGRITNNVQQAAADTSNSLRQALATIGGSKAKLGELTTQKETAQTKLEALNVEKTFRQSQLQPNTNLATLNNQGQAIVDTKQILRGEKIRNQLTAYTSQNKTNQFTTNSNQFNNMKDSLTADVNEMNTRNELTANRARLEAQINMTPTKSNSSISIPSSSSSSLNTIEKDLDRRLGLEEYKARSNSSISTPSTNMSIDGVGINRPAPITEFDKFLLPKLVRPNRPTPINTSVVTHTPTTSAMDIVTPSPIMIQPGDTFPPGPEKISLLKVAKSVADKIGNKVLGTQLVKDIKAGNYNEAVAILTAAGITTGGALLAKHLADLAASKKKEKDKKEKEKEKEDKKKK